MSNETVSLTPITKGIEEVYKQMDAFDHRDDPQIQAELVRLRNILEAVEELLHALCDKKEDPPQAPPVLRRQRPRP